ncbi:MAG: ABC transporter ATP-binding protein [Saprospiraceae bacterium]|nr:ABC transporter ATP-binding protein [Saprospiraceae bacterium]MBP6447464.1 ABC transporter ATP-binding protein [Saprospiraceae bacterium]
MEGLWRLLSRIKHYKKSFILSIISNILLSVFTVVSVPLLIPFFSILFDRVPAQPVMPSGRDFSEWLKYYMSDLILKFGKEEVLLWVCLSIVIVIFLKNLFRYSSLYFMAPLRFGIIYDLRKQMFNKFLELPLSFYSNERKGALMSSMTLDVQEVEWSILNVIEAIFKSPFIIVGSVFLMIYINAGLTLFVFILVIIAGLIIGKIVSTLKKESGEVQEMVANLSSHLEETIGGLRVIKGFNAEDYQKAKFEKENISFRNLLTKVVNRRDSASPASEFLGVSVVAVLLWYGSHLVFKNELQPDTFFAFVLAFYQVIEPAKSLASAYVSIQKGLAALDRIERIVETQNEIISKPDAIQKNTINDSIIFENVSFRYKDNTYNVLNHVSVNIAKGQIVALVGSSGAGKSTFVDLLPRFYDVTEGSIKIDNIDIRDISVTKLRELFGIVTQDAILFHDTIARNISFGGNYTAEEIKQAAIIANAHEFIEVLPEGYNTSIGDRGLKLSGGQRQRLTIARAVLRNPPILILDEATSALDSESERLVQDALHKLMKNRTSFVVAHRLTTIQQADIILVLENGAIVQSGKHHELLQLEGPYKKFVEMQSFA